VLGTVTVVAAIILIIHGLIHLIGTAVYGVRRPVRGLAYKTTLLGGRWDLGQKGIRVYGALWVLPTLGFLAVAAALLAGWPGWKPLLVAVTLLSLPLTVLDWGNAFAGAVVDLVILALVPLGSEIARWLS
jgi:hypothetical protein